MPDAQEQERREPIYGFDPDALAQIEEAFGDLPTDFDDLSEGGFIDNDVTIVGWGWQAGGEEKIGDDGNKFTTLDTLLCQLRVDSPEGVMGAHTMWYLRLLDKVRRTDGSEVRPPPSKNSNLGIITAAFENLGIASDPDKIEVPLRFHWTSWRDLTGLKFHRVREERQGFRAGQVLSADIPTEVFGFDNDVREQAGLEPAVLLDAAQE